MLFMQFSILNVVFLIVGIIPPDKIGEGGVHPHYQPAAAARVQHQHVQVVNAPAGSGDAPAGS